MTLLLREFRSKPGREAGLIDGLRDTATQMIQDGRAEAILICQHRDALDRILWIENRARKADLGLVREQQPSRESYEHVSAPRRLVFLDGFYHFPLPPCQVWWLEIQQSPRWQPELFRELLELARRAEVNAHVAGLSLYRAADEPTTLIGFLALTPGITPAEYFKEQSTFARGADSAERTVAWYPLSVRCTLGRLSAGASSPISPSRYPRTAFWARSGPGAAPFVSAVPIEETAAKRV